MADVSLTSPDTSKTFTASGSSVKVPIAWKDDGSDDEWSLSKADKYSILLCTGSGSYPIECFDYLVKYKDYTTGNDDFSETLSIDVDACDDGYYFFQVYIEFSSSKFTTHYSNRFELKDMTGSTKELTVQNTFDDGSPPDQTVGADTSINSKSFSITYTLQSGKTKYAPMQLQPHTTLRGSTWSRMFPTSSVSYFPSLHGSPNCLTTVTPGWSYTPKSLHNWAAVAPTPSVKYDPSERVTPASLSTASKRKRWLD
ncbi:Cell wall synthesis protein kre9 precursor [Yamadazyma tenuis]|uniref:Cell wall synthesis KRE9KNH1 n=1 Tax=Candida tenuis (strain ATCC 10573 / BCRC 21748 / CBS 615 / JCM 9827 / NBRC 10315 / NRRL Y-1498 / VKM Y-70) TaxID=590646 RepID=G3B232_CANTC|nr:cell wall synthesis KRE9KNH1 [Yamadazyma tenuis ATCC 10573]EGV64596.1 cell wall synthesis KRE9KNH1 [Yamadazyma tenuis ATCC 10573]WEJ97360.1 Cell wall synthesis protein kre9 precursor [Yamadazyma tenuis]